MFAAPFDMERALLNACVQGDKSALAGVSEADTVFVIGDQTYSADEIISRVHNANILIYTIDLLRVEYDASERRFIHYTTEIETVGPDGETESHKYSISTTWELVQGNYLVSNVQAAETCA